MPNTIETQRTRTDAFSQLKLAQKMLAEGRAELASAQGKIARAQELIDLSAAAIRSSGKITQRRRPR